MLCFDQKRHIKGEKYITPIDFGERLKKSVVSENSKYYYGYRLHENYCCISKSRWVAQ